MVAFEPGVGLALLEMKKFFSLKFSMEGRFFCNEVFQVGSSALGIFALMCAGKRTVNWAEGSWPLR